MWIFGVSLLTFVAGAFGSGPLCYSCFHYSNATDGENLQSAFTRDFGRHAPKIMGIFRSTGTVDASTQSSDSCKKGMFAMETRRCAAEQKCLTYTHAWKSSHYRTPESRRKWVMTWRDCVDATFDCDSSAMDSLEATCCTTDRCNSQRFNSETLLDSARK